jgi:hypothetical protein
MHTRELGPGRAYPLLEHPGGTQDTSRECRHVEFGYADDEGNFLTPEQAHAVVSELPRIRLDS